MATKRNPYQKQFDAVMERASSGGGITLADALIIKEYKAAQKKLEYISPAPLTTALRPFPDGR